MTTAAQTVLICRAPHPLARSVDSFIGQIHGVRLTVVGAAAEPTGRLLQSRDPVPTGHIAGWCPRCRILTEYRILENGASA